MPVKFDDINKVANETLSDDFQTSGFQFKAKQKTSWDSAVVTSTVDLFGSDPVKTPAKLTWKFPTPLGINSFCIDKLEMDKKGGIKLEASSDKIYPKLKVECKSSDLFDQNKITVGGTYGGIKDTHVKIETKLTKPDDFTAEATRALGLATCGVKFGMANITKPDVGLRLQSGPYFCSLVAKDKLGTVTAHAAYKATDELKCSATCDLLGKKKGSFTAGIAYDLMKTTKLKVKVNQDMAVSCGVKHEVTKGFTVLAGGVIDKKGTPTYGLQLSIE